MLCIISFASIRDVTKSTNNSYNFISKNLPMYVELPYHNNMLQLISCLYYYETNRSF